MVQTVPHFVSQWRECTLVIVKGDLSVSKATKFFVLSVFLVRVHHQVVLLASILQQTVPPVTVETLIHPQTVPHALLDNFYIHRLTVLGVCRMAMTLPQTAPHVFPILSEWEATVVELEQ